MAEAAIEGGPPAVPANDTEIKHVPEARDSREKVLGVFNSAFSLLENTPEDQLSEAEKWAKQEIKAAKEKTLDQGKSTFTNTFESPETGETFTQEEGIPIEDLLDFLDKKLKSLPPDSPERQNIINLGHILYRNSQPFSALPHRLESSRFTARVQQEAYLISQDSRATGNTQDDWSKAETTLNKRYELSLPPTTQVAPEETTVAPGVAPVEAVAPGAAGEPTPPTLEQIRREFVITNRTVDIRKRAAELAEEQLREEMRRGSAWNPLNWPRKIGLRITEEFQRQRYIERATRAMIDNNNSYLIMDVVRNAAVDATHRLAEERAAGKAKIEQVKTGEALEGQQVVEAPGPLRDMMINEIIRPIIDGTITNEGEIQQKLRDFVQAHEADPQIQAVFGRDATQYGRLAEYFATDLLETGELIRGDLASHRYALEQLNEVVRIQLANTRWAAETQASFNRVDKAIAWAERHRLSGILINPATIGAAFSLGTFGLIRATGVGARAAQFVVPGAGLLPGAAFAAFRRNYDLKVDRASHQVERAYARQVPPGARRREALERFAYNTASVNDLLNGEGEEVLTGTQRESLQTLLGRDLSIGQTTNQESVVRRIAEIKTRLDFSAREKVDLVTFAGREEVEQGRLGLIKAVVEARQALRNAGMPETEIASLETRFAGEWEEKFIKNREQQDRAFAQYRLRNAAGAAVFGGVAGLAGGILGQEAIAGLGRLTGHVVGETVIERGIHGVTGLFGRPEAAVPTPSLSTEVFQNLYQSSGGSIEVSSGLAATVNPDHSLVLIDTATGQPVPDLPKITLGPDGHMNVAGGIPSDLRDQLEQSGFKIDQGPNITEPGRTIVEQKSVLGPDGEWTRQATNIDHREWYSYDQPGSQGNELRFYTHKEGTAVILDMRNMTLGYQRGLVPNPVNVQEVIGNHEAGWYFSTPGLPQDGLWVSDGADGKWDGLLRLNPNDTDPTHLIQTSHGTMQLGEFSKIVLSQDTIQKLPDGNIATELYSRQQVFNLGQDGKMGFIEAGRLVQRPEGNVLQAFATIRGASPIPETVGVPVETLAKTIPTFEVIPPPPTEIPITPEAPPIIPIPFAPRHPLEPLGMPVPPIPEYYPYYPERAFPEGARLIDILRVGGPTAVPPTAEGYSRAETVTVDQEEGRKALEETRRALERADSTYVVLGGAIGDAVLSTAYVDGVQEVLRQLNKDIPITVVINQDHEGLLNEIARGNVKVVSAPRGYGLQTAREQIAASQTTNPLIIDLEHYRAENPTVIVEQQGDKTTTILHSLLTPSIELYNIATDQEQRFAHYMEELFSLPKDSLDPMRVRPRIELPQNKEDIYDTLATRFDIDKNRPQTAVIVESAIVNKRYAINNWVSVISQLSQQFPQMQFNIIFNPKSQAAGFTRADIENALRNTGVLDRSRLVSGSLLELAVLLEKQNLVLSNDTGLAHIATALEHGPSVVSLHIPSFPPHLWVASTKRQTGIVPQQGATDINSIPPGEVIRRASEILAAIIPGAPPVEAPVPSETAAGVEPEAPVTTETTLAAAMATTPEVSLVPVIGSSDAQGPRPTMEDAHKIVENFGNNPNQRFLAIYDGHGGRTVADFAAQRLHENFLALLNQGIEPKEALRQAYLETDRQIKQAKIGHDSGATAVTAFIQGRKLFVANVGDARAVLNREGRAERLSYDHKATDPNEKARIEAAGGHIYPNGYIEGSLAVARALGDQDIKKFVVADPHITQVDLDPRDNLLILACDGVWDVMEDQEAVNLIKDESDPQKASEILKGEAIRRMKEMRNQYPEYSGDNISVIVIRFGQQERPIPTLPSS